MNVKLPMMFAPGLKAPPSARPWQGEGWLPEHAKGRALGLARPFNETLQRADARLTERASSQASPQSSQAHPSAKAQSKDKQSSDEAAQHPVEESAVQTAQTEAASESNPQPVREQPAEESADAVEEMVEALPMAAVMPTAPVVEGDKEAKKATKEPSAQADKPVASQDGQAKVVPDAMMPQPQSQSQTSSHQHDAPAIPQQSAVEPTSPLQTPAVESETQTVVVSGESSKPIAPVRTESNSGAPVSVPVTAAASPAASTVAREMVAAPPQALPVVEADQEVDTVNAARVARGLQSALQQQGGSVTLRLHPPELGFVRIELQMVNGAVSATLQSDAGDVRQMLTQQLATLRLGLENQGLAVEKLNVQGLPQTHANHQTGAQSQQHDDARGASDDGRSRGQWANDSEEERQQQREARREARASRGRFSDLVNEIA